MSPDTGVPGAGDEDVGVHVDGPDVVRVAPQHPHPLQARPVVHLHLVLGVS